MPAQLTAHDKSLADSFIFRFAVLPGAAQNANNLLLFQFPPKITSDDRKGNWKEGELRGIEPVAAFNTSGPREITITATYVVDGSADWSFQKVKTQVLLARGYFARVRQLNATRNLVCKFKMWAIGGTEEMTCRIVNVGVKYSDTIVGVGDNAFPLRTDLTLDVRMWTAGAGNCGEAKNGADVLGGIVNVTSLRSCESQDWY